MSCFSTEELFEIVFYPLNFFNWISLISSLLFRYSIFKEHLSLSDIWSPWVLLVEMRRIELLTPCLQGRCSPSWATPPKVIVIHLWSRQPWGQVPSKLNNTDLRTCEQVLLRAMFASLFFFLRKEVIQPHLPIRLPCYDLTLIIDPTFGGVLLAVRLPTSGVANSHGLTGGVYKARERIHRSMLTYDY